MSVMRKLLLVIFAAGLICLTGYCGGGPAADLEHAKFEIQQNNYPSAKQILEKAAKKYPGNKSVDSLLGLVNKRLKEPAGKPAADE